jgi:hypothetical protein
MGRAPALRSTPVLEGPMDEKIRRDKDSEGNRRHASDTPDDKRDDTRSDEQRDELARRRAGNAERSGLTRRERDEQWPVG